MSTTKLFRSDYRGTRCQRAMSTTKLCGSDYRGTRCRRAMSTTKLFRSDYRGTGCRRAMSTTKLCGSDYSSRYKVSTGNEYNQVVWRPNHGLVDNRNFEPRKMTIISANGNVGNMCNLLIGFGLSYISVKQCSFC